MHMADALISPAVGMVAWAGAAGLIAFSARQVREEVDEQKVPLMGVMGAFVFAAQLINFAIPGTGSSGHLGGGLLLAILLGPHAAFLCMFSILAVQALLFADGGLLALGCNTINLGLFPCFVACPLVYRVLAGRAPTRGRMVAGSVSAAVVGLQFGAFGVVVETSVSGMTQLPFGAFLLLMLPVHLAIGLVEGLATAFVILFLWTVRPEVLSTAPSGVFGRSVRRGMLIGLLVVSGILAGAVSWFASSQPDGLEWAVQAVSGREELKEPEGGIHGSLARLQEQTAVLPDYDVAGPESGGEASQTWPAADRGTSLAGLVGSAIVASVVVLVGFAFRRRSGR